MGANMGAITGGAMRAIMVAIMGAMGDMDMDTVGRWVLSLC